MFYFRRSIKLMSNIFERAFRVIYEDQYSSFTQLPKIKVDSTIHQQNIGIFMKEVYKLVTDFSPPIASDSFQVRENVDKLGTLINN